MSCGLIDIGSAPDCNNLPPPGTRARLVIINYTDVDAIYESEIGIVSIGMKPMKTGYEFLGFRADVKKTEEVVSGSLNSRFRHSVTFVIYELTQEQKNNITRLSRGSFMAIVENNGQTDESIELLGREAGLKMVPGQIRSAYDNGGFYVLTLASRDGELEPKPPQQVGETYGEGIDIVDEVLGETVPGGGFDYELDSELA